jgi:hypothetical protein
VSIEVTIGSVIDHQNYGKGKVIAVSDLFYKIDFAKRGVMEISKRTAADVITVLNVSPDDSVLNMDQEELKQLLRDVIEEYSDISKPIELGEKWKGGKMVLQPGNPSLKSKEVPIETFFHKIVMVRDRLRVLEQNINSHDKLTDEDKVNLQQYITRIYGSLTTFNVLFAEERDQFVGERS